MMENMKMNQIDRNKILKMLVIIVLICIAVGVATQIHQKNSMTLEDYAKLHPESETQFTDVSGDNTSDTDASVSDAALSDVSGDMPETNQNDGYTAGSLTGALLNGGTDGQAMLAERVTYQPSSTTSPATDFYYEPLSENLRRYITGISYPAASVSSGTATSEGNPSADISYEDLRYVHILHYDFNGEVTEGELICNAAIASELLDIFYQLYRNEYQLEKVRLIDEYDGDDTASMEDNNTSCFNYREVAGTTSLSKHALGLAIDINPLYNPYITYEKDGSLNVSPETGSAYADRNANFPYKIDETDLCYKLFIQHGFTWGGSWNSSKDYQHFQKAL
jgi:hypothetical protein